MNRSQMLRYLRRELPGETKLGRGGLILSNGLEIRLITSSSVYVSASVGAQSRFSVSFGYWNASTEQWTQNQSASINPDYVILWTYLNIGSYKPAGTLFKLITPLISGDVATYNHDTKKFEFSCYKSPDKSMQQLAMNVTTFSNPEGLLKHLKNIT